ncbi:MAG: MBL fold metallo-hydrolase, partial [Promethearchaeia archaeon]
LRDYLSLGLVPAIPGIYHEYQLNDICRKELDKKYRYMYQSDLESYQAYKIRTGKPYLEALLLTHIHLDHLRNIKFMDPRIPIVMSEVSKRMIEMMGELNPNNDFKNHSYRIADECSNGSYFPGEISKEKLTIERNIIIAKPETPLSFGTFEVLAFPVDHSVPGAMAYKISTEEGESIIYTGDLRFHGHRDERKTSERFVQAASAEKVDVLITEGTRIDESEKYGEDDLYSDVSNLLIQDKVLSDKLIIVAFPWKGITRFKTVYKIARDLGRTFVIQPKLAFLLHGLGKIKSLHIGDILKNEEITIFLPRKQSMTYSKADYSWTKAELSYTTNWDKDQIESGDIFYNEYYERENISRHAGQIHEEPSNYILHLDFYNLKHLIDICPPPESYFFNLKTEPFDIEGELEEEVVKNWMERFQLNYQPGYHASGHASGPEILDMIQRMNPQIAFPVHTEHPELFPTKRVIRSITKGTPYYI